MEKKRETQRKVALPACAVCDGILTLRKVIPAAHIFPELRTYQCFECGHLRTVEDDCELARPVWVKYAA